MGMLMSAGIRTAGTGYVGVSLADVGSIGALSAAVEEAERPRMQQPSRSRIGSGWKHAISRQRISDKPLRW